MNVYIDTSVFGGYFDKEFAKYTKIFFSKIDKGLITPYVSSLTLSEILKAPINVNNLYQNYIHILKIIKINSSILDLGNKYVDEKALTKKSIEDAIHIATATFYEIDFIVSWNFKHIVNPYRIPIFNKINLKYGYNQIDIMSPIDFMNI